MPSSQPRAVRCSVPTTRKALAIVREMWGAHSEEHPLNIARVVAPTKVSASEFAFAFVLRRHRAS